MAHGTPMPVRILPDNLRHFLDRHCRYQNPAERQYRDDFIRVFGEHRILPLEQPTGDPCPFIARSLELIAEAIARGQYVTYDEHTADGKYQHTGAAVLTRPLVEFALRKQVEQWDKVTAYFKHKSDLEAKTFRSAARRFLDFYTDGSLRVPEATFRVWVLNRTRYRTNIRFGDPKAWGEDAGRFDLNRLPPWG
jgi:hypothetical protein